MLKPLIGDCIPTLLASPAVCGPTRLMPSGAYGANYVGADRAGRQHPFGIHFRDFIGLEVQEH